MDGWIKLHRKIVDNPYYFSEKFTRSQAWIDLLIIANHKEGYFFKRGVKVIVKRGQCGYDVDSLAKRWSWSRGKASRFISDLEMDKQIVRQKNNVTTLITILNYEEYQGCDKADSNTSSIASDTANGQQTDTNKNDKNDKNDKKIIEATKIKKTKKEFIPPTINEVKIYFDENGYTPESGIRAFNYYDVANWFDSKGNKVKNWKQKMQSVWFTEKNQKEKSCAKKEKVDPISENPYEYYGKQ